MSTQPESKIDAAIQSAKSARIKKQIECLHQIRMLIASAELELLDCEYPNWPDQDVVGAKIIGARLLLEQFPVMYFK